MTKNDRRTKVDFSKHVLTPIVSVEGVPLTFRFADPNTNCYAITFINSCGILAVTGDCGNWIFCREFHPSKDGGVSDGYWCEKLRIASTQKPADYSPDKTRQEINEMLSEEDIDNEDKEYLTSLLDYVDECEERYLVFAHDNLPGDRDHEYVPFCKELNPMLAVVFDAFDEICRRQSPEERSKI